VDACLRSLQHIEYVQTDVYKSHARDAAKQVFVLLVVQPVLGPSNLSRERGKKLLVEENDEENCNVGSANKYTNPKRTSSL
jgi:hypothetical protein